MENFTWKTNSNKTVTLSHIGDEKIKVELDGVEMGFTLSSRCATDKLWVVIQGKDVAISFPEERATEYKNFAKKRVLRKFSNMSTRERFQYEQDHKIGEFWFNENSELCAYEYFK